VVIFKKKKIGNFFQKPRDLTEYSSLKKNFLAKWRKVVTKNLTGSDP
jgi:hypothetical protein